MRGPIRLALIAIGAPLLAAPALADGPLTRDGYLIVRAGQTDLIHLDPNGKIVVDQGWPAPTDPGRPADADTDHLLISFTTAGPGATLVVKSGYANAFNYHARIRRGSTVKPTSVCPIIAKGAGFETWQQAIDVVEVGDFKPATMNELRCQ